MPQFRAFDYGQAVGKGQQLAENRFRLGETRRAMDVRGETEQAARTGDTSQFEEKFPLEAGQYKSNIEKSRIEDAMQKVKIVGNVAAGMTPYNYMESLNRLKDVGVDVSTAPPQYDPQWVDSKINEAMGYEGQFKMALERMKQKGAKGKRVNAQLPGGKIVPAIQTEQGFLESPRTGERLPDALIAPSRQQTGGPGDFGVEKKTKAGLEEKIVNVKDSLARLKAIKRRFKPEYQTWSAKLGFATGKLKEKAGMELSKEDQKTAKEFYSFKRRSIESINLEIKRITGAQMSEAEATRIRQGFPDPGEGILDGDSPTQFSSKLDDVTEAIEASGRRYEYLLRNGILGEGGKVTDEMADQYPIEDFSDKPSGPKQISSDDDYNSLQSGEQFIDPNGQLRVKP